MAEKKNHNSATVKTFNKHQGFHMRTIHLLIASIAQLFDF